MNKVIMLASVALVFLSIRAKADTPAVDCDMKTVEKFCDSLKAKEQTQLRSKIPYTFSNGESMPSVDSITGDTLESYDNGAVKIPWGKMQRLQKIYAETQKYAQEAILQGRKLESLSDEEKNLIQRIKSMKLSDLSDTTDQETCKNNDRFGYSPRSNSLIMCPEMAGYPASGIVWAMAAFMGRGLGTCATGAIKYVDAKKKVVFDLIPVEKHPFNLACTSAGCAPKDDGRSLRSCLIQGGYPDTVAVIDFTKPELKKILDAELARAYQMKSPDMPVPSENAADAAKDPKNVNWMKGLVTNLRECMPEQTGSRVDAGIQDWFGSEVAARYIEDHPLNAQTAEDNLQPIAAMVDFKCRTPRADELERKFHVPLQTRFDSAIFANDRLRKAMNCSPKVPAKRTCNVSLPPGTATAPSSGAAKPATSGETAH